MDRTTEMLSAYACRLNYHDLHPRVVHQVKRTMVDTLGCAMGGYLSEPAKIARAMAAAVTSATPSRVLGTNMTSSPEMAGFANGVMVRYLDCNDSYFSPGGGHPSDMIPAVLALADPMASDGRSVITAIALAYEVFCRLSDEVVASDLGWDQGAFSVIGAVCGVGKIMGLSQQQMGHAISLAVTPHLPLGVTRTGELSMWKGCATASATRSAIFAAALAAEGMMGPFEPFEGRRGFWEQAVGKPVELPAFPTGDSRTADDPFRITQTIFKSYPSQIHTQGPIGLAVELRDKVALDNIDSIRINTYKVAASTASSEPEKWDPKTRETADHSIPFLVAAALKDGPVTPATFTDAGIADTSVREIMARMSLVEDPEFTAKYPGEYNSRITITDRSGGVHSAHTAYLKGHPKNPLSDAEVEAKFRAFASGVLTAQQCGQALEAIWALESLPDLEDLFDSLVI